MLVGAERALGDPRGVFFFRLRLRESSKSHLSDANGKLRGGNFLKTFRAIPSIMFGLKCNSCATAIFDDMNKGRLMSSIHMCSTQLHSRQRGGIIVVQDFRKL